MIAAIAVIGKSNNPLYIKTVGKKENSLRFHHIVNTSLDVIEETSLYFFFEEVGEIYKGLVLNKGL